MDATWTCLSVNVDPMRTTPSICTATPCLTGSVVTTTVCVVPVLTTNDPASTVLGPPLMANVMSTRCWLIGTSIAVTAYFPVLSTGTDSLVDDRGTFTVS